MPTSQAPTLLTAALLDRASADARRSPRGRRNLNLHGAESDPCNRLLNAIEPGSYVAPHRHLDPAKDESIVAVRGRLGVIFFDADGGIAASAIAAPAGPCFGFDIPHGTFHSVLALEPGTVFFEAKAGPYAPLAAEERAPWAPAEGSPEAAAYLRRLESALRDREVCAPGRRGPVDLSE